VHERIASLTDVAVGERARIVSLTGGLETEKRLSDMGLGLDSEVEVLIGGPRSPMLVAAGATRVAIEPDLACRIHVHCHHRRGRSHRRGRGWRHRHGRRSPR
jgi:Fe2+ transport system protein FeoA